MTIMAVVILSVREMKALSRVMSAYEATFPDRSVPLSINGAGVTQ